MCGLPTLAAPSAYSRSSVVSPAAGGNLTAAGDGITRPRTAPTKPLCAEPTLASLGYLPGGGMPPLGYLLYGLS